MNMTRSLLLRILIHVQLLLLIHGYLPIENNANNNNAAITGAHGKILRDGIDYLAYLLKASPGLNETFTNTILQHKDAMYIGLQAADMEAGTISILDNTNMPRNELSHFYNPTTSRGYKVGRYISWIHRLEKRGWLSARVSLLMGPTIASTDMVDWYYARAIRFAKRDDMEEAMSSLGYAAHIVMDSTIPQHAHDCGDENDHCGHRRYEEFIERNYDDWNFVLNGPDEEQVLSVLEMQELATTEGANALVQNGAAAAYPLLDMVQRGGGSAQQKEQTMEEAAKYLIPLAQQLVATLALRFVADLRNSQQYYEEAVVLQITSVELDGYLATEKHSQGDFTPVVRYGGIEEKRGYVADSNFVYMTTTPINSHAWTFVQRVDPDNFPLVDNEPVVVSFELEIREALAEKCGDDCGDTQKRMAVGPEGSKTIQISLPLDAASNDEIQTGSSTGCDVYRMARNNCKNAVKVEWTIGRSFLMKGYTDPMVDDMNSLTFSEFVTSEGILIIVFSSICLFVILLCLLYIAYRCYRRRKEAQAWKSRKLEIGLSETTDVENAYFVDEMEYPNEQQQDLEEQTGLRRPSQVTIDPRFIVIDDDDDDGRIGTGDEDVERNSFLANRNGLHTIDLNEEQDDKLSSFPPMRRRASTLHPSSVTDVGGGLRKAAVFTEDSQKSSFDTSSVHDQSKASSSKSIFTTRRINTATPTAACTVGAEAVLLSRPSSRNSSNRSSMDNTKTSVGFDSLIRNSSLFAERRNSAIGNQQPQLAASTRRLSMSGPTAQTDINTSKSSLGFDSLARRNSLVEGRNMSQSNQQLPLANKAPPRRSSVSNIAEDVVEKIKSTRQAALVVGSNAPPKWEILDDDSLGKCLPMTSKFPLRLESDLSGQEIYVARLA